MGQRKTNQKGSLTRSLVYLALFCLMPVIITMILLVGAFIFPTERQTLHSEAQLEDFPVVSSPFF